MRWAKPSVSSTILCLPAMYSTSTENLLKMPHLRLACTVAPNSWSSGVRLAGLCNSAQFKERVEARLDNQ